MRFIFVIFPFTSDVTICLLHNFLIVKLLRPLSIEACTSHVGFSDRHFAVTLLSFLVCLSSKFGMILNSFSTSRKCSLPKNVCPRVNSILLGPRPRSSSNIICSSSESYITVSWYLKLLGLRKGLEKFNCHTEKSSRGLQPPVHRPSGCLVVRRITYVISHIGGVIHE